MLRKHISLLAIIVGVSLSGFAFAFLMGHRYAKSKFVSEITSYKEQQLPQVQLVELKSGEDYFGRVNDGDALLVFFVTGCDACKKEMQVIVKNVANIKSWVQIYGVMFEDKKIVEQYVQDHNINFPILLDKGGKLRNELRLKHFPTNIKLKNGTVKDAWIGIESDEGAFLKRVSLFQI